MIIVGLMAMPYIDINQKGNGYYTFNQRKFAYITFLFGFLVLWVDPDPARHLPARPELELLRAVRILGPAQGRSR